MSGVKMIDFESPEYDGADVLREDARIDAVEAALDAQRHAEAAQAFEAAVLQHAVNTCLSSCLDCLNLLYIPREQQLISDVAVVHDSWRQEAEPEPCSRDSWLRGAIPEAPLLLQHNSSSGQAALLASSSAVNSPKGGNNSRPMSGLSSVARRSSLGSSAAAAEAAAGTSDAPTSSIRRASVSRSSGRPPSAIGRSPSVISSQSVKDEATIAAAMSSSARRASIRPAAQQQQQQAAPKQPSQNNDAEDRLRQELQVRRQQEAIAREMKQKAEQARAALIAVQKELKGKDYTYDSSGKLVLLQKVDPEHLPAPPGPQFKVHTPAAAGDADAAGKQGSTARSLSSTSRSLTSSTGKGSSSSTGNGKLRDSKAPAIPPSDYKQTASQTQPPVLEALRPAAGVTLRAGAAAKPGPNRDLAGHPTRTQYQQQAKAQNQQATRAVTAAAAAAAAAAGSRAGARSVAGTVAGSASMRSSSSPGWGSNAGAAAASTSGRSSPAPGLGGQAAAAAAAGAAASSSGRASPAPAAAGDSRGGLSSAGTASMLSSTAGALSSAGQPLGAGSRAAAAAAVQQRPASPDVNLVLVSAADWGAVGSSGYSPPPEAPVAVHKPTDKQIKEEFGRTTFLPKIRSPVQTLRPPKRQPASTGSLKAGTAAPNAR